MTLKQKIYAHAVKAAIDSEASSSLHEEHTKKLALFDAAEFDKVDYSEWESWYNSFRVQFSNLANVLTQSEVIARNKPKTPPA